MAVAGDAPVGDARGVKELGVDALVALAGALVAREAAFGRAPVEAVVVLQLVERPVVEPQRHVVFRAVCLLPALGHGGSVEKVGVRALAAPVSDIRNQLIS